jgi:hypothetical protein
MICCSDKGVQGGIGYSELHGLKDVQQLKGSAPRHKIGGPMKRAINKTDIPFRRGRYFDIAILTQVVSKPLFPDRPTALIFVAVQRLINGSFHISMLPMKI